MRCTDCIHAKETIPAQIRYIYCTVCEKEMPTWVEGMEVGCKSAGVRKSQTSEEGKGHE